MTPDDAYYAHDERWTRYTDMGAYARYDDAGNILRPTKKEDMPYEPDALRIESGLPELSGIAE